MPVMYPPPMPPDEVPVSAVPTGNAAIQAQAQGLTVHLIGFGRAPTSELLNALKSVATPPDVAAIVTDWLYDQGLMTAQVVYASDRGQVYVSYKNGRIQQVKGRADLRGYFEPVAGAQVFDQGRFERARVLASAYSERALIEVQPHFVVEPSGDLELQLKSTWALDSNPGKVVLGLNNHGSRYAGQNGVDFLGRRTSTSGGELQAFGRLAPTAMNAAEGSGELYDGTLAYNQVSSLGVIAGSARWVAFDVARGADAPLRGQVRAGHLDWSDVLSASFASRLLVTLRGGYVEQRHDLNDTIALGERFWTGQLMPTYVTATPLGSASLRFEASAAVLYGRLIGDAVGSTVEPSFTVVRPQLHPTVKFDSGAIGGILGSFQIAERVLPQHEQWTLGGAQTMSAYLPGALYGDDGAYYRAHFGDSAGAWKNWRVGYELFGELGQSTAAVPGAQRLDAMDAGLSLRLQWRDSLWVSASWAYPIATAKLLKGQQAGGYFSLGMRL